MPLEKQEFYLSVLSPSLTEDVRELCCKALGVLDGTANIGGGGGGGGGKFICRFSSLLIIIDGRVI